MKKLINDPYHYAMEEIEGYAAAFPQRVRRVNGVQAVVRMEAPIQGKVAVLISKRGRSARLGERSLGHMDAGATSLSLILRTIAESIAEIQDNRS